MHLNANEFLLQVSNNKPCFEQIVTEISKFDPRSFEFTRIGEVEAPLEALRAELFGTLTKDELHEILVWFFMSSTK